MGSFLVFVSHSVFFFLSGNVFVITRSLNKSVVGISIRTENDPYVLSDQRRSSRFTLADGKTQQYHYNRARGASEVASFTSSHGH